MPFLKDYKDEIGGVAAMTGVAVAILGFGLTICQIHSAAKALRATNGYQIQKDAREIVEKISADPVFLNAMKSGVTTDNEAVVSADLWKMFNFYLAVYRQNEAGGISSEFAASYRDDFCGFFGSQARPMVESEWKTMVDENRLGAAHQEMRKKWCAHG